MKRACKTCAYLRRSPDECPCARCWEHEGYEWRYTKAIIVTLTAVVGVLAISCIALCPAFTAADVLGVPVEVPAPVEVDCGD